MPVATAEQPARMLDSAAVGRGGLVGVNLSSPATVNAALRGCAEPYSAGIIRASTGEGEVLSGTAMKDMVAGARALQAFGRVLGERSPVLVAPYTDHCPPDTLDGFLRPLLAESLQRREQDAQPLFHSPIFDRSTPPLEDNRRIAAVSPAASGRARRCGGREAEPAMASRVATTCEQLGPAGRSVLG